MGGSGSGPPKKGELVWGQRTIAHLRDTHHMMARLFAIGFRKSEIAKMAGFSYGRMQTIEASPAFRELVALYRADVQGSWKDTVDSYWELATHNMMMAERMLHERLQDADETGEYPSIRELLSISSDRADRFGYPKTAMNVNLNHDVAAKLDRAIERSGKTIDGEAKAIPEPVGMRNGILARGTKTNLHELLNLPAPAPEAPAPKMRRRI